MSQMARKITQKVIGWREWVGLPDLELPAIKAKVDTGARTSSLHASKIETFKKNGALHVRFIVHPARYRRDFVVQCEAPVVDHRIVSDSSGRRELRYVISSTLVIGDLKIPIEITLYNRETMSHRMLLGRTAMQNFIIDPSHIFLLGRPNKTTPPQQRRSKSTTTKKTGRQK